MICEQVNNFSAHYIFSISSTFKRKSEREREMSGPLLRPQFVMFGSSIVQYGLYDEGWMADLSHLYARKVLFFFPYDRV